MYPLFRPKRSGLLPYLLLPPVLLAAVSLSAGTVDHREAFSRLPASPEVLYLPAKYSACFGCHPAKTVIEEEDFNVETNFRDTVLGKNLHSIHVYRQPQGTNCSACHRVDPGTGRPGFLPEIRIAQSEKGGTCTPACHRPKEYRNAGRGK